ncbi:MAG: 4-hydroxy-tetrahydrodipicolinate reductase [Bacteroidales bacterium]|nr:4-hydroxy-tetrahydrodipicolinate reductase [Bacteroidales bacterium]
MKIALLGYGKMGKIIEKTASQNDHEIVAKIDHEDDWKVLESQVKQADVAIEFSTPQTAVKNIIRCFEFNIPIVVGTTGWDEQKNEILSYAEQHQKTLFYASNFSIGVNLFFELNKQLAQMMKNYTDYKVGMEEIHHLQKLDKPSGTAISLAKNLPLEISEIKSFREKDVFGIHTVSYESNDDIIEIKHEAKGREGFAKGAVFAAEWLIGKTGIFTMSDILKP